MNIKHLLTNICLVITLAVNGQETSTDSVIEYYNKYPQEAIKDAGKMYKEAVQTQNSPLLIKSLILKTTFSIQIDGNDYPKLLNELEDYISQEKDIATKSILHSYAGELYSNYYYRNRTKIAARTSLDGATHSNIQEWSANLFKEKVFYHYLASIESKSQLQQSPIQDYSLILIPGKASDSLRPTLYDFLCHRVIKALPEAPTVPEQDVVSKMKTLPALLSPLDEFVAIQIPVKPLDYFSSILQIYQDLLIFHRKADNKAALILADLNRLDYTKGFSNLKNKNSLYMATLQKMEEKYITFPIVVEVIEKEVQALLRINDWRKTVGITNKQKALALCESGIQRFPNYNRINILYELVSRIKEPRINITYPGTVYPGKEIELKIASQNIGQITLTLFQFDGSTAAYIQKKPGNSEQLPGKIVYKRSFNISSGLVFQDSILKIPSVKSGLYKVIIESPELKEDVNNYLICNQLFTTEQTISSGRNFFVRDLNSGLPVKNAKIRIYNSEYKCIDSIYTNKQGVAETNTKEDFYETVNQKNPNGYLCTIRPEFLLRPSTNTKFEIFTDRRIYRPGQTVFFKGIAWFSSPDSLYVQKKQTYDVFFRTANGQNISQKQFTTNDFGSFSGEFIIPEQVLNGYFSINVGNQTVYVNVAEYKRPEFEITFIPSDKNYAVGDVVEVKGNANSFSGMKLTDRTVKYEISRYTFFRQYENDVITRGIASLNHDGEFEIQFKTGLPTTSNDTEVYSYQVKATITDAKGETQEATTVITVYSNKAFPVIMMLEEINKNNPGKFRFSLRDVKPDVTHKVRYTISKLVSPQQMSVKPVIKDTIIEKIVQQGEIQAWAKDSISPNLSKCESGAYLFTIEANGNTAKHIFYLYATTDKQPPIPVYNWLASEQTRCYPGESARVLFGTSAKNAYVIYEIYTAKGLIKQVRQNISNGVISIDIPFLESYGAKISLSINYVKDGHFIHHVIPIFRIQKNSKLIVQTKVFRDKLIPGQKEQWEVEVKNQEGKSVPAEVLAMMYDASLDNLLPYKINFSPNYQYINIPYKWNAYYYQTENKYSTFSPRVFEWEKYTIPPFQFDYLNVYSEDDPNEVNLYSFGDQQENKVMYARSNDDIRIRGISSAPPIDFRQNFAETAFFYPQLQTDANGNVVIKFTAPESNTKWRFTALAYTKDLAVGELTKYATTSRQLMVSPNMPRYLRSGDKTEIKVTVSNLSDSRQSGKATLELFTLQNKKILFNQNADFNIPAGESQTVGFIFDVPQGIDLAGCRISAASETFSDGEQRLVPILPDEVLVTSAQPIYSTTKGNHTFTLKPQTSSRKDYRLTLELAANPVWYAVLALPSLLEPQTENVTNIAGAFYVNTIARRIVRANPKIAEAIRIWTASNQDSTTLLSKLEQNNELKSILLEASPWMLQAQSETERMQALQQLFDQNRLEYLQSQALKKLAELQTTSGGWSWFKGMYANRFITNNVLAIMAQANITGEMEYGENDKAMQMRALRYLDNEIKKDFENKSEKIRYEQLLYLYTRSMYRDIPLGDALDAHKYYMSLAQKQWAGFSFYEKAIAATAMYHYGLSSDARAILKSLRQYAVTTPEMGMYWPNNRNIFYRNSGVLTHTAIMEAFYKIEGNIPEMDKMKQWLLNQKRTQSWESVPATVNAIYAILLTGSEQLSTPEELGISLGKKQISVSTVTNPLGYVKESIPATAITGDMLTVNIKKTSTTPTWGGLYLQYFEKLNRIKKEEGQLSIDKKLFIEQVAPDGTKKLIPANQQPLQIGDKVIARLILSLDRDMEFLHLKDLRAACFEPQKQLSGNQWKFGTVYYEDVKDAATNLFFNSLSKGTYVIEYPVWVNQAGEYQDGIATLQSVYAPEFNAHSSAEKITVKNKVSE